MTQEDIIRMAREAGMAGMLTDVVTTFDELERFAALVRADENEANAKMVDHILKEGGGTWGDAIRARGNI
jgi:hypothetical protein